jgi:hypothetical protein
MQLAAASLLLALVVGSAADVTGKWEGKLTGQRDDGSTSEDTALLILEQKGTTITGTVGGNDADRHPITKGTIAGNKIALTAKNARNDREYTLELTVEGDVMKGTLATGERKAQLVLKRRKE